ncbi:pyrroloquinoline quinone precursor peptide PqqA [Bosea sp. 2YAB26]|uniref:pyrroloquinoline quinone precursor peptide PqqA n=1 Tax=Bosea sp. 2YAB26 TaxID=3237478 RepID=UPI003F8EABE6
MNSPDRPSPVSFRTDGGLCLQQAAGGCRLPAPTLEKAGDDLEKPIMRKWKKPAIIEVTVGCEVTSYAPAQF